MDTLSSLNLGIIGNCNFSALINRQSSIVWCCLPRFDSKPIFSRLLTGDEPPECETGFYDIVIDDFARSEQKYLTNTAILETKLFDTHGNILKVIDFAPFFKAFGRTFIPPQFVRMISNEKGRPRICIRIRPASNNGKGKCEYAAGSNHISYFSKDFNARLTTDIPIPFVEKEVPFLLTRPYTMFFGVDESFRGDIVNQANDFFNMTKDYWLQFTRELHIPLEWQDEVIRSAITLKMCQVEPSGAILAAMTTSIPEFSNSKRNWDYRFCWLRDSYHTIQALNRLGTTRMMESYLGFITNVVAAAGEGDLQPLYGLLMETDLKEYECNDLKGYRGQGPVRIGNDAYKQIQNDNYGSVIMSLMLMFYDERLSSPDTLQLFNELEHLGDLAVKKWNTPDAGLWELRNSEHIHTFSSAMCWAACDRLSRIAGKLGISERAQYWENKANPIRKEILERAWCPIQKTFVATLNKPKDGSLRSLDASVLLLAHLQFIDPEDERFVQTVKVIGERLMKDNFCFRYVNEDDFGFPDNSFIVCTFWYIEALCFIGEKEKARALFENLLKYRNHVGLFSEDLDLKTNELWGNFPQTYSMVGIINTAITLSKPWRSIGF